MSLLTQASLILTPNAYKTSKLYSIVPTSGNGDMTVVRATTATRTNSSGLIETVGNNIPRLNYDANGSASILLEPLRTNLLVNSVWAGGGSLPTSWTSAFATGTSTAITSIKNPNVSAYRFVTSTTRQVFSQAFSFLLNSVTTISVYLESVTTAVNVNQLLLVDGTGTGTAVYLKNNVVISSSTPIEVGNTYSLQFTCTLLGSFSCRVGCGVSSNITGDITLSMPQVEQGTGTTPIAAYSTSFIPTTTIALTRNEDVLTRDNIFSNGLITNAGGTWFVELDNNIPLIRDFGSSSFALQTSSVSNSDGLVIKTSGGSALRFHIAKRVADIESNLYTTLTDKIKVAIKWNGTTADFFVNGIKVVAATAFTPTLMNFLFISAASTTRYIKSTMLFPTPLTDTECATLTTL